MASAVKERLKSVKSLVPDGTRLLDVGSDHAALPVALFGEKRIKSAVISDVHEKPLERAKEETKKAGYFEKCSFYLSDGFDSIDPGSFDTAAVCGMGGVVISDMIVRGLANGHLKRSHTLILQPMTDIALVRKCLWDNGYEITDEVFSAEGKYDEDVKKNKARPYVALKACFDGKKRRYAFGDLFSGKIREKNTAFLCFDKKNKRMLSSKFKGIVVSLKAVRTEKVKKYRSEYGSDALKKRSKESFRRFIIKKLLK